MDAPLLYATVVGGCIAAFGLRQCFIWFSQGWGSSLSTFMLKHFIYPYILPRMRLVGPVSRMHLLLQVAYWAGTAVCNVLGIKSLGQASSRAGTLAIFNLIPLTLGDRISVTASMLGVPSRVACRVHSTFGWMATVQALVHVLLSMSRHPFDLKDVKLRFALAAALCILALLLFSLPFVRRASHEVFLWSHYILGIVALFALWRHELRTVPARAFLIASVACLVLTQAVRWLCIVYRNVLMGKPWPRGKFFQTGGTDAVEMRVRVARGWMPKANQYFHVCVPGVTPLSFTTSHPYCIAWWDNDANGSLDTVSLLIKPYQGFSSHAQRVSRNVDWRAVAIDGPYGIPLDVTAFGTIVIFASSIGIASQLPLIKQALEERASHRTPLRRILLVWLIENSSEMEWVKPWMQRILDMDLQFTRQTFGYQQLEAVMELEKPEEDRRLQNEQELKNWEEDRRLKVQELKNWEEDKLIFRSEVYALYSYGNNQPFGRRTKLFKGKRPDVPAVISREYKDRLGKMLVTVSAEQGTRDCVRKAVTEFARDDMVFREMDFQPEQERGLKWKLAHESERSGVEMALRRDDYAA